MKPETEQLLHQCRTALLQQSNEQLHTLFVSWFERLVGEESIEETLDDLCLLLGYGIRSVESQILYATSTAWWEVEGCADLEFGERGERVSTRGEGSGEQRVSRLHRLHPGAGAALSRTAPTYRAPWRPSPTLRRA